MTALLFVDTDVTALAARQRVLALDDRWDVRVACDGASALAYLADRPADVVLTEMRLPDMAGADLLRRAQAASPRTVRVLMSSALESDTATRAATVAHQVLAVPCDAASLLRFLESVHDLQVLFGDERLRHIVGGVGNLPSHPRVYFALTEAIQDPRVSMAMVADIVERDAAIASRVLRLANSAFFGLGQETASVHDAIAHVGFSTLHSLVAACEVFGVFPGDSGGAASPDSYPCARLARRIGRDVGNDDAFAAALFRDLGVLILRHSSTAPAPDVPLPSGDVRVATREDCAALGLDYAQVGAYLLAIWSLPSRVVRGVLYHAEPWREPSLALTTSGIVYIAELLMREDALSPDDADRLRAFTRSRGVSQYLDDWREAAADMRDQPPSAAAA